MADADGVAVREVEFFSSSLDGRMRYTVLLPPVAVDERLPVLYFLHGANSGPREVMERSQIARLAASARVAVVLPDGGFSYYTNARHGRHARWEDAMTRDLPQDVAGRFPVFTDRGHMGIAGISMGGYGAARLALRHPEQYGFAGVLSGALDITRRPLSLRRLGQSWRIIRIFGYKSEERREGDVFVLLAGSAPEPRRWFVSCGASDPLAGVNARFAGKLGIKPVITAGGHEWRSWNEALPRLLAAAGAALR